MEGPRSTENHSTNSGYAEFLPLPQNESVLAGFQKPEVVEQRAIEDDHRSLFRSFNYAWMRRNERPSKFDPGPPPDGGLRAWMQVLVGHLVIFNSWGYITSFGLFEAYYETTLNRPFSDIAWVGSVQIFLIYFVGTFSGRALDAGYYHPTLCAGCILQLVGVFMTSISTKYWQLFLAQGICQGLGDGLVFCPTIALMATYFSPRRRTLAISFATCGAPTGGMVFPVIARQLLDKIGFPWTVRIMGFVMLFNVVFILALAQTRIPPRKTGPLIEWTAFRELPFVLFAIGSFFSVWGVYFAFYYVSIFGQEVIHVSSTTSITLLLIINGVGIPGRLIPALIADRYTGPVNAFIPTVIMAGILLFCWAAVDSFGGLISFVIIYGFFANGVQSLYPATSPSLTADLSKTGVRTGMLFSIASVACLTGPPLAGALIQREDGKFLYAQMFGGGTMLAGAIILFGARVAKTGFNIKQRM